MTTLSLQSVLDTRTAQSVMAKTGQPANQSTSDSTDTSAPSQRSKTIDMRSISLNEINALIKSGEDSLLYMLPPIASSLGQNSTVGTQDISSQKVDFLGHMDRVIAFAEQNGDDTSGLKAFQKTLQSLHGKFFPEGIDLTA